MKLSSLSRYKFITPGSVFDCISFDLLFSNVTTAQETICIVLSLPVLSPISISQSWNRNAVSLSDMGELSTPFCEKYVMLEESFCIGKYAENTSRSILRAIMTIRLIGLEKISPALLTTCYLLMSGSKSSVFPVNIYTTDSYEVQELLLTISLKMKRWYFGVVQNVFIVKNILAEGSGAAYCSIGNLPLMLLSNAVFLLLRP